MSAENAMHPRDKKLMQADGMLVNQKYAEALAALRELVEISEERRQFPRDDFNWQLLLFIRMQRAYKSLGAATPKPLEKLIKYCEIVARNHPAGDVLLTPEEARVCAATLAALPRVEAGNRIEPADPKKENEAVEAIMQALAQNKERYKLGVFYRKGF